METNGQSQVATENAPRGESPERQHLVTQAVNDGIARYIESRKTKVPAFVAEHFSFRGALRLHKKAFGKDLYRAPLNILWAMPALVIRALSYLLKKVGFSTSSGLLTRIPSVFRTDVQNEVNWLIYTELMELPYRQEARESAKDTLLETILSQPKLSRELEHYLEEIHRKSAEPAYRKALERNLAEYATSRMATAELAGSLISLASGFAAFHKVTPGALAGGSAAAAAIAQQIAVSQFWLGQTLGAWYYTLFPATASTGLLIAATGSVMAALTIIATFAGVITDPLQAMLGLHQKRLLKFLDALQDELSGTKSAGYRIKDQYIARVFDILDLLRTAVTAR